MIAVLIKRLCIEREGGRVKRLSPPDVDSRALMVQSVRDCSLQSRRVYGIES